MNYSQLQQHSNGASQAISQALDVAALAQLVAALSLAHSQLALDDSACAEYAAELETLKAQSTSPKPKASILSESLKSIRTILEGAAGNVLASDLLTKVNTFLQCVV